MQVIACDQLASQCDKRFCALLVWFRRDGLRHREWAGADEPFCRRWMGADGLAV